MPAFIAAFLGGLINIAGTIAGRVFLALGIGVATYTGLATSLDWLKSQALANMSALPTNLVQLLSFLGVGQSISIITSAILVRAAITGLQSGTVKRLVFQ